jgi:hypothetical protein
VKFKTIAFAVLGCATISSSALAQATADDVKWVNQCLADNKDATVSMEIVRKYCVCMNDKMDSNETRSITQWEKANPQARVACDRESGWR